ncbi:mutator 2 [Augochlora pura]
MMDILPKQVVKDDFISKQQLSHLLPYEATRDKIQIGALKIGSILYPINEGITNIGRHPRCNIVLIDQTVSKKHAKIESNNGELWICDLNSSNKTKLNSSILRPGRYYELKSGSIVKFGMVQAIYAELSLMNETLITNILPRNCLEITNTIIPGTPDTTINYSPTSERKTSMISGTQAEKGDYIFRRPPSPPRSSASSRKSYLPDSSIKNSMNENKGSLALSEKEDLNEQRVSISSMQKQKSLMNQKAQNDSSTDIHDVKIQNICLSSCNSKHSDIQTDRHDTGTQKKNIDNQCNVTNIHDIETQHDADIQNLKTPRKTDVQNSSAEGDGGTNSVENEQTEEAELKVGLSSAEACDVVTNVVTQSKKAIVEKDKGFLHSKYFEMNQKGSQDCPELLIAVNINDKCSKLDGTRDLLGLPNLLGDFTDNDSVTRLVPKSINLSNSPTNKNEMTINNSEKENLSDAAIRINVSTKNSIEKVTQRVDYTFKTSIVEDDSDNTDQGGVFQTSKKINLYDIMEGNLNETVIDVNKDIESQPKISTQELVTILKASQSKEKSDTMNEVKIGSVNEIVNENIAPALLMSASKNSPSTRLSRTNKAEELNNFEHVVETTDSPKSNKSVVEDLAKSEQLSNTSVDVGSSEYSVNTSVDVGSSEYSVNTSVDVRSSEYSVNISVDLGSSDYSVTMLESDEEDIMSGLPEVQISGTLSNSVSTTSSTSTEFTLCTRSMKRKSGAKKIETKTNKAPKKLTRKSVARLNIEKNARSKTRELRSTALSSTFDNLEMNKVPMTIQESNENKINKIRPTRRMSSRKLLQSKSNPSQEEVRRSLLIRGNGRTCAINKKDIDSSSVLQVRKQDLIEKKAKPAGKIATRPPRAVKKSLSSNNITERTIVKKMEKDVNEKEFMDSTSRKRNTRRVLNTRSSSANILGYVMRKDSSVFNPNISQHSLISNQESDGGKQLRVMITRLSFDNPTLPLTPSTAVGLTTQSNSSKAKSDKSTTVVVERNNSRHDINVNVKKQEETNQNAKGIRAKSTRKRRHASAGTSQEIIEDTFSEVYELNNPGFEAPTSKAKRTRITRSTTNVDNEATKDTITEVRRNTATNNTGSKETTKRASKKGKVQKVNTEERNAASTLKETSSSEINSSMDISAISTPTRSKRNMSTSFTSPLHKILFTGISNNYTKLLAKLGSSQVEDPTKCTVLVTDKVRRTVKFLCALAQAVPIVSVHWLVQSERAGSFAVLDNYVLKDSAAETKFGFSLSQSLKKAKKQKLLDGYTVVLTPNVTPPLPELKTIINSCGGKPLIRPPSKWPEKAVIVSAERDIVSAKKFLTKAPKTVTIQSTEFILTGVLRQEIDFVKYKLT